jgi:hypothetical protein
VSSRLLEERYAPLTYRIGFLNLSLGDAFNELRQWRGESREPSDMNWLTLDEPLERSLVRLDPLSGNIERELLVTAGARWTAYFSAYLAGYDPDPVVRVLTRRTNTRGVVVGDRPDTLDRSGRGITGTTLFAVFDAGRTARWVQAIRDGDRWVWESRGPEFPFEDAERYARRRIRDRLDTQAIASYCNALGINLLDPHGYGPTGAFLRFRPSPTARIEERSLAAARARLGLPEVGVAPDRS